jgi:RND family efflux transporter MFP subunit
MRAKLLRWTTSCAALLGLVGCQQTTPTAQQPGPAKAEAASTVKLVRPERKTVRRRIEQPGFNIEAFQETPLFPRIPGYVAWWSADIGDRVAAGQVLAELYVPEMEEDLKQKEAAVGEAEAQIRQAQAAVKGAKAQHARAEKQYQRLARASKEGGLTRDSVEELRLGFEATAAALEKAEADVAVAEAHRGVARANRDYSKTMLGYARIKAPYAGVVTQRNVSQGDFVQPAGTGAKGQPMYVVCQLDPVRVFVNVPGAYAGWVKDGDPVTLLLQGAGGEVLHGKVTRNARSLTPQSRTLRTEIDLPNPDGKLLPGMYVQAGITVEHPNVWTLPEGAIVTAGDQAFAYRVEDGKAVKTLLQVGLRGGGLVEVFRQGVKTATGGDARWEAIRGDEEFVASGAAGMSEGQPVRSGG